MIRCPEDAKGKIPQQQNSGRRLHSGGRCGILV